MPAPVETPVLHADAQPRTVQQSSSKLPPPPNSRAFTIIRITLGILLLITATLKLSGGSSQVMRAALPFLSPRLYAAGVILEAILGMWLISGIEPAWSWIMSIGFFSVLAYMSCRLGIIGQSSCGCLGKLHLSPWWAFSVDVVSLVALFRWRPKQILAGISARIPSLAGGLLIVGAIGFSLTLWYGSIRSALAHIRGETIVVNEDTLQVGEGRVGELIPFRIRLTNYGDKMVRIVGGTSDCSCITTQDLPLNIPSNETRDITVTLKYKGSPGVFRRQFSLFADIEFLRVMPVAVTGRVVE